MTTTTAAALDPTRLIIAALAGLVILLLLIINFHSGRRSGHRADCRHALYGYHKLCK